MTDVSARAPQDGRDSDAASASSRFRRAAETFEHVHKLPLSDRERALESLCGGDAELLVEVRSLLSFHDQPSETLDTSILRSGIGAVIGRYRITDVLGEGGMGTVYLAVQEEPVRREVALKVIKLGMDTRQIVRRFEAERQALAQMEHPNVARVLDAGATSDGRPYFVMELVRGRPLTAYCDGARLAIPERLRLFLDVCSAVQHAHQKGVIHRDLKPSNIIVAELDGRAMPKVIDFGVAKALLRPSGDRPVSTLFGDIVGTPDFMSPEQAGGNDVDVRSDVYALGVILYELLAGTTPLRARLGANGRDAPVPPLDELRRVVRDEEPLRPANAISNDRRAETASDRSTDARSLERLLRGDLAWIVLKALALAPSRRYTTVAAFAEDIERFLHDDPVVARAPSAAYWLAKFARRHTVSLVAACLVVFAILSGLVLALYGFERARQERDLAVLAQKRETLMGHELRAELFQRDVDRGRQRATQGNLAEARDLLWTAHFAQPSAPQATWALRELMWTRGPFTTFFLGSVVRKVLILPDARHAIAGGTNVGPALLDSRDGSIVPFDGPKLELVDMHLSDDGAWLVCGDASGGATLWDVERAKFVRELRRGPRGPTQVAIDGAGYAVAAWRDGVISRIALDDPGNAVTLAKATRPVTQLARSARGAIAAGLDDGTVVCIQPPDADGVRLVSTHRLHDRGVLGLAYDADGSRLASASAGREYRVSDATTFESMLVGRVFPGTVQRVRFSADGASLLMPGWWDTLKVDIATGTVGPLTPLVGRDIDVACDGSMIAYAALGSDVAALLSTRPDDPCLHVTPPRGTIPRDFNLVGGATLAASAADIIGFDDRDGRVLWMLPTDRPRYVIASPDGSRIATIDGERRVTVQSVPDGAVLGFASDAILGEYGTIRFDPRGERVAFATRDYGVRMLDLRDGSIETVVESQSSELLTLAFSPDGNLLEYAVRDSQAHVLDLTSKETVHQKLESSVFSAAFSEDGTTLALGEWAGDIALWDLGEGSLRLARGHSAFPSRLVAHPLDPELFLSCADDGSVRVWHRALGRELLAIEPFGPRHAIRTVGWDRSGERIFVVGLSGEMLVYRIAQADQAIAASEESERARLASVRPR